MRSNLKKFLLASYVTASTPIRWGIQSRLRQSGQQPAAVLFYHRVADSHPTPWTIGNKNFKDHVSYLRQNFDIVSLTELQQKISLPNHGRRLVAITFDDGYAENFDQAIPWLVEEKIPFTYFVSTHFVLNQQPFPHDQKIGLNLPPNTPEQIRWLADNHVNIGGHTRTHANLGLISDLKTIENEILGGLEDLRAICNTSIDYFAFPYGDIQNISQMAIDVLRNANLRGICSAYGEFNRPESDLWHIKRIHGDPGMLRLKNWLTLDPRKLRRKRRFPFSLHAKAPAAAPSQPRGDISPCSLSSLPQHQTTAENRTKREKNLPNLETSASAIPIGAPASPAPLANSLNIPTPDIPVSNP